MFKVRRIVGVSMEPGLSHGQIVVMRSLLSKSKYKSGDVVIIKHEGLEKIKRIHDIRVHDGMRQVYLLGDNAADSLDSRIFGWIPLASVRAKLLWPKNSKSRFLIGDY